MRKRTKTLLTGAGAAAAGIAAMGAATYASTKYLVRMAMDRKQPKIPGMEKTLERLRGSEECRAFLDAIIESAEKIESKPHDVVTIAGADGEKLVGHWFACPNAKRILVAMHGWRSSWSSDFGTIADFWHSHGCSVLYAEQRGQGSSGGDYIGFGLTERFDCLSWIQWVNGRNSEHLPIYLAGVSMGATTVLMAAALDLPENVKGIMADCGFTSARDIWQHVAEKNLHMHYRIHGPIANRLCKARIQMRPDAYSTIEALERSSVPVLFAHGAQDRFVPVEMTYENYRACKAPKRLLIVPGADHGMSHYVEKQRYETAMEEFWRDYDQNRMLNN